MSTYSPEDRAIRKVSRLANDVFSQRLRVTTSIDSYRVIVVAHYDGVTVSTRFAIESVLDVPEDVIVEQLKQVARELGLIYFTRRK